MGFSNQIWFCDISVAVSGPKGLMVPVLRGAEKLTFKEIELEIKRLALRAREGEITVDEMTGAHLQFLTEVYLVPCFQHL